MSRTDDAAELGRDPLDPVTAPSLWAQLFPARRAMLGVAPTAAPAIAFLLFGALLGPHGLAVLTTDAVLRLSPAVSIGLATLGVFVGLALGRSSTRGHHRLLGAAAVEVLVTLLVVTPALYVLLSSWAIPVGASAVLFAVAAGVSSSASAASGPRTGRLARVALIADLDDGPLVLLGSLVVGLVAGVAVWRGLALTVGGGLLIGAAGWLLFERARGAAERGVFVAGAVALLGGVAAYTSMSPLLAGAVAALVWVWSPGGADRLIADDLGRLQHPLVALLLVVAGASIEWTPLLPWIVAPLVLLRLLGKLTASLVVSPAAGVPPGLLATVLLPQGVLGVAIALNVQQVSPAGGTVLLSAVAVATGISELLAAVLLPGEPEPAP